MDEVSRESAREIGGYRGGGDSDDRDEKGGRRSRG